MLLIIAINKGQHITQYNIINVFVHADIDADIYTILPIGVYNNPNKVCYLNKALYRLKQSPILQNKYLKEVLETLDFRVFLYDEGVYINKNTKAILIYHIDDILVLYSDIYYIRKLAKKIQLKISLDEIGQVSTFLGNEITIDYKNKKYIIRNQLKYQEILVLS